MRREDEWRNLSGASNLIYSNLSNLISNLKLKDYLKHFRGLHLLPNYRPESYIFMGVLIALAYVIEYGQLKAERKSDDTIIIIATVLTVIKHT